jgi:hypothetical protein
MSTTPTRSASSVGSAVPVPKSVAADTRSLAERARVGEPFISANDDYSQQMAVLQSSIPEGLHVRWVSIHNSAQINKHVANGYTFVRVDDGITTLHEMHTTDASGQYICVGDCILMACAKEHFVARRKRDADTTARRLDAYISGETVKEIAAKKTKGRGITIFEDSTTEEKSTP